MDYLNVMVMQICKCCI